MQKPTQNRFFLTRQSANLMEDLLRRLNQAGSISLLHGVQGVGISRLLQHFFEIRLNHDESILVRFDTNNTLIVNGADVFSQDSFTQILEKVNNKSTVLIDQFDHASLELQQTILKFWSIEAFEKGLKLIISVQQNSLQEFITLSRKFHLEIDSVQLEPLNDEERLEYLKASSCAELRQSVVLSSELKKMLKLTRGIFSQLELFLQQNADEINCIESMHFRRWSWGRRVLFGFFTALVLILVLTVLQNEEFNKPILNDLNSPTKNLITRKNPIDKAVINSPVSTVTFNSRLSEEGLTKGIPKSGSLVEKSVKIHSVENQPKTESQIIAEVSQLEKSTEQSQKTEQQPHLTVFQQRLLATEQWLSTAHKKSASIQIMTIGSDQSPEKSLNRYLKKLQLKQIDLEKVKIYPLTKRNKQMYGVLYGEFASFNLASRKIKSLPDVLKANRPIPRSVKGIIDEMDSF